MDERDIDALARSLTGTGTRRVALRLLAAGVLGGLTTRLGLAEDAAARAKKQHHKRRPRQKSRDRLQTEGKRKGKGKGKKSGKKKPQPQPCGPDQHRCGPGPCIPINQCCSNQKRCDDGSCASQTACCPGQQKCADGSCAPATGCCVGERRCGNGVCIPFHLCCRGEKECDDGSCIAEDECCPDAPAPLCLENEEVICCHGELHCHAAWDEPTCDLYGAWLDYNAATCRCECPAGSVEQSGTPYCCPADYPEMHGTNCYGDVWNDWVCPLGFGPCEGYPQVCCPIDWPPPQPDRQGDSVARRAARTRRNVDTRRLPWERQREDERRRVVD